MRPPRPRNGRALPEGEAKLLQRTEAGGDFRAVSFGGDGSRKKRGCTRASSSASSRVWATWVSAWRTRARVWRAANWIELARIQNTDVVLPLLRSIAASVN